MSNGSERTPERCVHAPDGPDWAGLREPSSWKERALAAEEAQDELRRALDDAIGVANKNKIALDSAEAERDALRAQLDSMTVEWGTKIVSEPGVDVGTEEYARRNVAQWNTSRYHKGDMRGDVVSRRVSPWTVVEGDDQ